MGLKMRYVALAATVLGWIASVPATRAAILLPGGDVAPSLMVDDLNNATILADTGIMRGGGGGGGGIWLEPFGRSAVLSNYAGNPFGPDALTFIYQIGVTLVTPEGTPLTRIQVSSFEGVQADVGFYPGAGLVDPVEVTRTADVGASIFFHFADGAIASGTATSILVVNTDARSYSTRGAFLMISTAGGGSGFTAFGAPPLVPEPSSIVAAATGLAMLGAFGLRRSRPRREA